MGESIGTRARINPSLLLSPTIPVRLGNVASIVLSSEPNKLPHSSRSPLYIQADTSPKSARGGGMPKKHGVTFKHLIATSSQDLDRTYPNPSNAGSSSNGPGVQDLLDRSRLARPIRPRLVDDVEGVVWAARPSGRLDLELEEGPSEIHPCVCPPISFKMS